MLILLAITRFTNKNILKIKHRHHLYVYYSEQHNYHDKLP